MVLVDLVYLFWAFRADFSMKGVPSSHHVFKD